MKSFWKVINGLLIVILVMYSMLVTNNMIKYKNELQKTAKFEDLLKQTLYPITINQNKKYKNIIFIPNHFCATCVEKIVLKTLINQEEEETLFWISTEGLHVFMKDLIDSYGNIDYNNEDCFINRHSSDIIRLRLNNDAIINLEIIN